MNTFPMAKRAPRTLRLLFVAGALVLGLAASGGVEGSAFAGTPAAGADAQKGQGAHQKRGHHGPKTPAALLSRFDANADGKLAIAELPEKMRARFSAADSDKDGFLSAPELKAKAEQHAKARFAKRDANGDGALTEAEVGAQRWAHLKVADSNGDARLTFAELTEARASGKLKGMPHGHRGAARRGGPGALPKAGSGTTA